MNGNLPDNRPYFFGFGTATILIDEEGEIHRTLILPDKVVENLPKKPCKPEMGFKGATQARKEQRDNF